MNTSILDMMIIADYSIDMNYNIRNLPIYVENEHLGMFPQSKTTSHWNEGVEIIQVKEGSTLSFLPSQNIHHQS